MKDYGIYYDLDSLGDVLMIEFKPDIYPDEVERVGDVAKIYTRGELIGINIFDIQKTIKIKARGLLPIVSHKFIDIINERILAASLPKLDYKDDSGFKICQVIKVEDHPFSDELHIVTVSLGEDDTLTLVSKATNVKNGLISVVAIEGTFLPNGAVIEENKVLGVVSHGMLCSPKTLNMPNSPSDGKLIELDDRSKIGEDFFKTTLR
jgi:tRNA-binding protein